MNTQSEKIYIYGKHALIEAIQHAPQTIDKVFLVSLNENAEIESLARAAGIAIVSGSPAILPKGIDLAIAHQGVVGLTSMGKLMHEYKEFINTLHITPDTALAILGEIQDPQNVGAIIRSAAAFGIAGVLVPEHRQSQITGTVVKVSAGMAFRVPLVSIGNVNTVARDLKERGFWIYGLSGDASQNLSGEKFDAPAVFILGNEERGIRLKTRELCDITLSIPMNPQCESLNVAVSSAVAFYAWSSQHPQALKGSSIKH